jgi:hypothetical protein
VAETLTTELEAINSMLGTIGMAPINSLAGTLTADVTMAQNILKEVSREVQQVGWHWNSEYEYPLTPDVDGHIVLASNILRVDLDNSYAWRYDVTQRGSTLYDKKNRTDEFSETLKANVVLYLPWDSLPEPARRYITIRAARIFSDRAVGSETLRGFTAEDEFRALASLKEFEGDTADHNIFDNYDTFSVIDRGPVPIVR